MYGYTALYFIIFLFFTQMDVDCCFIDKLIDSKTKLYYSVFNKSYMYGVLDSWGWGVGVYCILLIFQPLLATHTIFFQLKKKINILQMKNISYI